MNIRNPDTYKNALEKASDRSVNEGAEMYVVSCDGGFFAADILTVSMMGNGFEVKCTVLNGTVRHDKFIR